MSGTARKLVEQALFLCTNGERPPGAPPDDMDAETWRDWAWRAETFLRTPDPRLESQVVFDGRTPKSHPEDYGRL